MKKIWGTLRVGGAMVLFLLLNLFARESSGLIIVSGWPPPPIYVCAPPPSGLVSWWRAEGNGFDSIGTNDAYVPSGVTYVPAEVGLGFALNGNTNRILVLDAPELNFGSNQDFSIEAWIQPLANPGNYTDASGQIMSVIGKRYAPNTLTAVGYEMFLAGGRLSFQLDDTPNVYHNFNAGPDLRDGQFHHVAVTVQRNLTNGLVFYVDGQIIATFDPTVARGDLSNPEPLRIGNHPIPNFPAFYHGIIDEASLYHRALSSNEISAIYGAGTVGKCTNDLAQSSCTPPPAGIVGWWPAEGNANDLIGTNDGTFVGTVGFTNGEVGQAFSVDGAGSYVAVADSPSLDALTNSITVELWLKSYQTNANSDWVGLVTKGDSSWRLMGTSGSDTAYFAASGTSGDDVYGTRTINDGQWHHVAGVYDGTNVLLYVDGTLDASAPSTGLIAQNSYPLALGGNTEGAFGSPAYFFNGLLDEASVYNRALSANEIAAIYLAGSAGKCTDPLLFPPEIITGPASQTVLEGGTAVFSVVPGGTGPFAYQWTFNGHNVVGATNVSLSLANLHPGQAGSYAVTVTTPYGVVKSANAVLTVITRNILIYKYTGTETIVTTGQNLSFPYSGLMFPARQHQWHLSGLGGIQNKKTYWVNPISQSLLITIPGLSGQSYTLFGDAGSGYDDNGQAHFHCNLLKGWNTTLTIGTRKTFLFPNTFAGENTHADPDSQTGQMKLDESTSSFIFAGPNTQTANNTGLTLQDLVNAQVKTLKSQGYQSQ